MSEIPGAGDPNEETFEQWWERIRGEQPAPAPDYPTTPDELRDWAVDTSPNAQLAKEIRRIAGAAATHQNVILELITCEPHPDLGYFPYQKYDATNATSDRVLDLYAHLSTPLSHANRPAVLQAYVAVAEGVGLHLSRSVNMRAYPRTYNATLMRPDPQIHFKWAEDVKEDLLSDPNFNPDSFDPEQVYTPVDQLTAGPIISGIETGADLSDPTSLAGSYAGITFGRAHTYYPLLQGELLGDPDPDLLSEAHRTVYDRYGSPGLFVHQHNEVLTAMRNLPLPGGS